MDNKSITYNLDTILTFGKHNGKTIKQVIQDDPTYIYWMYDKKFTLSQEVRKASNTRTKERRIEAGLSAEPKRGVIGFRETAMLNHLVNNLNEKHFDHAFDEEQFY